MNLYAAQDGALIASANKPVSASVDLEVELLDTFDALMTMGIKSAAMAAGFDAYGTPVDVTPLEE